MKEMIAVCGLECHECGAFLATKENSDQKRAEVAQEWYKLFKVGVKIWGHACKIAIFSLFIAYSF